MMSGQSWGAQGREPQKSLQKNSLSPVAATQSFTHPGSYRTIASTPEGLICHIQHQIQMKVNHLCYAQTAMAPGLCGVILDTARPELKRKGRPKAATAQTQGILCSVSLEHSCQRPGAGHLKCPYMEHWGRVGSSSSRSASCLDEYPCCGARLNSVNEALHLS